MSTYLSANSEIKLHDHIEVYTDFQIEYFEDTSGKKLTIEEVKKEKFQTIRNAFTFGYNTNNFWFRMRVVNDSDTPRKIYLELTEIIHKTIDLYFVSSDSTLLYEKNGLDVPVEKRQIKVSNPTFSLQFAAHEKKELYLKLSSIYGVFGSIELKTPKKFYEDKNFKDKLYMFYYGAILMIGLYNLFIYLYLKEKIYLYYVSYVFVFVIWSTNYKGLLLPFTNVKIYDSLQISIPLFFILLILFTQTVLETKRYFVSFHKILNVFIGILLFSLIWMIIDMHTGFYFMNIAASPLLPFILFTASWALYKGHNIAKIYLFALSIYLISMIILSQLALGFIPYTILLSNAPIIGSFFEIILLSLLLAYRIDILRQDKLETQKKLLEFKVSESKRLSTMVTEKTNELNNLNRHLVQELEDKKRLEIVLRKHASLDSLTGILNRRSFFDACAQEIKTSKRYNRTLSFLIMDIDFFKKVNDTYGHLNGDIVLLNVVETIKHTIRSADILGRIGGEEFAVLMPETNLSDAFRLADRIRENIAQTETLFEDKRVKVTVSIGVEVAKSNDSQIQTVLRRADLALFEAKKNGRNQICCADTL